MIVVILSVILYGPTAEAAQGLTNINLADSCFTRMTDGQCIIGMKRVAMIPLISFDTLVNVGSTQPLRRVPSWLTRRRSTLRFCS